MRTIRRATRTVKMYTKAVTNPVYAFKKFVLPLLILGFIIQILPNVAEIISVPITQFFENLINTVTSGVTQ